MHDANELISIKTRVPKESVDLLARVVLYIFKFSTSNSIFKPLDLLYIMIIFVAFFGIEIDVTIGKRPSLLFYFGMDYYSTRAGVLALDLILSSSIYVIMVTLQRVYHHSCFVLFGRRAHLPVTT